jgi:hypothetical protein
MSSRRHTSLPLACRGALLPLTFLLTLSACHSRKPFAPSLWFYRSYDITPTNWDSLVGRFSFLELGADSMFTQDFGRFYYGNWKLNGNQLYLTNQYHVTYIYTLPFIRETELGFKLGKERTAFFQRQHRSSGAADDDPFSVDNNRWRIPAKHRETVGEIRQRLLSHLHFWELYFKWGAKYKDGALDVTGIPTPLKIYNNGFGLKHFSDLSPNWRFYFYDSADCRIADTLIKGVFKRNNIKWPDGDSQVDLFIGGIQQVEGFLREE